ncbi:MAG: lysophospholipid acyltransferase family protein [bacterium]
MQRAAFWLRASAGVTGFGIAVTWYAFTRLLPMSPGDRRQSFARLLGRLCCGAAGLRVRIVGQERLLTHHPCVYVANHQSQIDYPIVGLIFPGSAVVMGRQVGDWPIIGPLFRGAENIALDRDVPVRAAAALLQAERTIREQKLSVWMFAEGTRGKVPGVLGPFKRGAFRLAAATGAPIVPVVISPLKPHTDLRARRLSPHDVVIHVLEPVFAAGASRDDEDSLREKVRGQMQRTLAADITTKSSTKHEARAHTA